VDLYPLMCRVLGIVPAPNNGSLTILNQALASQDSQFWLLPVFGGETLHGSPMQVTPPHSHNSCAFVACSLRCC
jgi:hypothetical protein